MVSKLSVTTKERARRWYDLKNKNLIAKCSLITSSLIEHKYNHTLKIFQVFETLMQLPTQNNESVSYCKTQIEKRQKVKEKELKIHDLEICVVYSI